MPHLSGRERTFSPDELIVSKTDPQGRITYANDVFLRLSGYDLDEVLGQPHNVIRHPEMPRGVFKLLWERLAAGREVFAFINNRAKNGDFYWVLAHVTPSYDARGAIVSYHSNRRVPSASGVRAATELYRDMLAVERRHGSARDAAAAGLALLERRLAERGIDYDEYIWSIIDLGRKAA